MSHMQNGHALGSELRPGSCSSSRRCRLGSRLEIARFFPIIESAAPSLAALTDIAVCLQAEGYAHAGALFTQAAGDERTK